MRRMAAPCPSAMKSRGLLGSVRTPDMQGLTEVRVRSPRPIPATETRQQCEIFLCFRECASPWECSDLLPARIRTVSWIQGSIQMLRADASAQAISAHGPAWRALPLPCSGVLPILPDLRC